MLENIRTRKSWHIFGLDIIKHYRLDEVNIISDLTVIDTFETKTKSIHLISLLCKIRSARKKHLREI